MIEIAIAFSRYLIALLYGTAVAVSFAGMDRTRKNDTSVVILTGILFLVQILFLSFLGMDRAMKLYPLLSHLPVAVFILLYLKRPLLISLTSVFVSFLCCQPPRWIGAVLGVLFGIPSMDHIGYILTAFLMYYLLDKYVVESVRHLMERSVKSCLLFGAIPAIFYIFDFATTVYTDLLYRGTRIAVQFIPFATSAFYFMFVLVYNAETQKQANIQRERDLLDIQFKQAQTELSSLWKMQQISAAYRHDMRHHISLLQNLASEGHFEEIKEYLNSVRSDIEGITPKRFCENETVNLILSAFSSKAKQADIKLTIDAKLPDTLTISDTELCSLLSNALENAIHASTLITDTSKRHIKLLLFSNNNKLCIDVRNRYAIEPVIYRGMPVSKEKGHGYGTKSMAHVVEKHKGVYQFSTKDSWFIFQAAI